MLPRFIAFQIAAGFFGSMMGQAIGDDNLLGAQLAASCAACHRLDGGGSGAASIIGLKVEALTAIMLAFKSDNQSNQIMHIVSASLSDEEIAAVAQHLADLKKEPGKP